jgi:hypothetical protein
MTVTTEALERQFRVLHNDYGFEVADLARVYDLPPKQARRVLERAKANAGGPASQERLLSAIFGGRL